MEPPCASSLLAHLPAPAQRELLGAAETCQVAQGETIFASGASAEYAYILGQGRVRLRHLSDDGFSCTMCILSGGDLFCCLPVMDGGPHPVTAVAATEASLQRLPLPLFRSLFLKHPRFARAVLEHLCRRLRTFGCARTPRRNAGARLAESILAMEGKLGADIPLTRCELGELSKTTVETAIREIKGFERRGWVALRRGHVRVLDRAALVGRTRHRAPTG